MKKCNKCGEVLPLHMFNKKKDTKDKLAPWCKECARKNNKVYRDKNKEKIRKKNKAYYKENKEEIIENNKAYREENKEEMKKKAKVYYEENKEEKREKAKAYYEENKEEMIEKGRVYYRENKEEMREKGRERVLKLPDYYVRMCLKSQGIDASLITPELIELKRAILKVTRIIKQKESKNI